MTCFTSLLVFLASIVTVTAQAAETKTVVVTGASTISPLMSEIGKRFEVKHPGTRIDVQSGGSSRGVNDARSGLAQIGMVSRPLKDDERDLTAAQIANDGVAMIIHRDNPVKELTNEQIVAVYTGKTTDWSAVGGKAGAITVVNKAEGRSTLELFLHHFKLEAKAIKAQAVIGENEHGIKLVAGNPQAIAYVSIGTAESDVRQGVPIRLLPLAGIPATTDNVASGKFPLARPLNLVTRGAPQGLVADLIRFARSAAVDDLVKELAFVPVKR